MNGLGHKKEGEPGRKEQVFHQQLPEGGWEHGDVPGTQQDPLCVLNRSTPSWDLGQQPRQGDRQAGEWHLQTSPGDQCPYGHQPQRDKSMSHGWKRRRSGGGGAVERPGPHHSQGVPVQRVPAARGGRRVGAATWPW